MNHLHILELKLNHLQILELKMNHLQILELRFNYASNQELKLKETRMQCSTTPMTNSWIMVIIIQLATPTCDMYRVSSRIVAGRGTMPLHAHNRGLA